MAVVVGTSIGMLVANAPTVLPGEVAARKLPLRLVYGIAAAVFAIPGVPVLLGLPGRAGW